MIKEFIQNRKLRVVGKYVCEALCCVFMVFMVALLKSGHVFKYNKMAGFFCKDRALLFPFFPKEDDLVQHELVLVIGLLIGSIFIIIIEWFQQFGESYTTSGRIPTCLHNMFYALLIYLFGFTTILWVFDALKMYFGRLRPYFVDVCWPNVDCTQPANWHIYHTGFACMAPKKPSDNTWLSFPSGHTLHAFYFMIYMAVYLQYRMTSEMVRALRIVLQFVAVFFAFFTGISRYIARKHHPTDILGGAIFGISSGTAFALWAREFYRKEEQVEDEPPKEGGA